MATMYLLLLNSLTWIFLPIYGSFCVLVLSLVIHGVWLLCMATMYYVLGRDLLLGSSNISQGVRQGTLLSPLLYAIYINDLLVELQHSSIGISIDHIYISCPTYADDELFLANSQTDIQYNYAEYYI